MENTLNRVLHVVLVVVATFLVEATAEIMLLGLCEYSQYMMYDIVCLKCGRMLMFC